MTAAALSAQRMAIEPTAKPALRIGVAEQVGRPVAEKRSGVVLALTHERLRVDREPRLTLRPQDVAAVEVLMQQDRLAL